MRPVPRRALGMALLLALPLLPVLAACSDPAPPAPTRSAEADGGGAPVVATPIDTGAPVKYDAEKANGARRNEIGEVWKLDGAAANACAHAEFAFRAPETGGDLGAEVSKLRSSVGGTKSKSLLAAVAALPASPTAVQVQPVLEACVKMGYQL